MSKDKVYLVGPMGAGRSTIGRVLAGELNLPFHDTDRVMEERTGADIPGIFDVEGESGFRARESGVLAELAEHEPAVIVTGGGIVLSPANRDLMRGSGFVCYLTAAVDQLVERTARDKKRPLLQVENPRQKIVDLLAERDPLYRQVADFEVVTDLRSPRTVGQVIVQLVERAREGN